jgi:hypothetical protein
MQVLVIHDGQKIKVWLVGEQMETAAEHIKKGYPSLAGDWATGKLPAVAIDVPEGDEYRAELYEVKDGIVQKKA